MAISDLPVLSALRTKMQWHQARQRVLSENVANSDTPNFRPRDLVEPKFDASGARAGSTGTLVMAVTSTGHIAPSGGAAQSFDVNSRTPARRQCREPGGGDDEGIRQPDGLCGGDLALQQEPAPPQNRDRQGLRD